MMQLLTACDTDSSFIPKQRYLLPSNQLQFIYTA